MKQITPTLGENDIIQHWMRYKILSEMEEEQKMLSFDKKRKNCTCNYKRPSKVFEIDKYRMYKAEVRAFLLEYRIENNIPYESRQSLVYASKTILRRMSLKYDSLPRKQFYTLLKQIPNIVEEAEKWAKYEDVTI